MPFTDKQDFLNQLAGASTDLQAGNILDDYIANGVPGTQPTPNDIINVVANMDTSLPNADVISLWSGKLPDSAADPIQFANASSAASGGSVGTINDTLAGKIGTLDSFENAISKARSDNSITTPINELLNGSPPSGGNPKTPGFWDKVSQEFVAITPPPNSLFLDLPDGQKHHICGLLTSLHRHLASNLLQKMWGKMRVEIWMNFPGPGQSGASSPDLTSKKS
jgi:hypothetical protein